MDLAHRRSAGTRGEHRHVLTAGVPESYIRRSLLASESPRDCVAKLLDLPGGLVEVAVGTSFPKRWLTGERRRSQITLI